MEYDHQWWDFDDALGASHMAKLRALVTTLRKHFGGIKYLGGHVEFAAVIGAKRTCPGNVLLSEMAGLRKAFGLDAPTKE